MTRKNLVIDPSLKSGTTAHYIEINQANLQITDRHALYGTESLLIFNSGKNGSGVSTLDPIPVVAGEVYAASVYARIPLDALIVRSDASLVLSVEWRDAENLVITTSSSGTLALTETTWSRLTTIATAPERAVTAHLTVIQPLAGINGGAVVLDGFMLEQADFVGGFVENRALEEELALANRALSAPQPAQFGGLQLQADVLIGNLVLNTIDEDGAIWVCTDIEGWWGQTAPESPDIPRGSDDGSYDVSGRHIARLVTISGVFYPRNSDDALTRARDRLVAAIDLVRTGGWFRTDENPSKAAFVRLNGTPQIITVNSKGRTEFSVTLKAGDPIKYAWYDASVDGTRIIPVSPRAGAEITNEGTASVTGTYRLRGPLGTGSTVHNHLTNETLTTAVPLRGQGAIGAIALASVYDGVATIKLTDEPRLYIGDIISIAGAGLPLDSVDGPYTVLATSDEYPYSVSFRINSDDLDERPSTGQVSLVYNDLLEVDTYNKTVVFNGVQTGHRSKLRTLTDWLKIAPGINPIEFTDDVDDINVRSKSISAGTASVVTEQAHFLVPGEDVAIALPVDQTLVKKSLTNNTVLLTTERAHGFAVGDRIVVESTERSSIDQKSADATSITLRTAEEHGISPGDSVTVRMPTTATITQKSRAGNVVTLRFSQAHGFSPGDTVQVQLPGGGTIRTKALENDQATITLTGAHNIQIGDQISVSLATSASVTAKSIIAGQGVLTATNHRFSTGDVVTVNLNTGGTITATQSTSGAPNYLVTMTTTAAHGMIPGDRIEVNTNLTAQRSITNRNRTATTATIGIGTNTYAVGEKITVSGVENETYNGTFTITSRSSTAVAYAVPTGAAESSRASSGTVLNTSISSGYNGVKVVETTPSATQFTFKWYGQSDTAGSNILAPTAPGTVVNLTNRALAGNRTIVSTTANTFTYNI